jgi:hypothetical protein
MPDIDGHRDAFDMMSWSLEPTDCVIFNSLVIHGAPGNPSQHKMRRYVSRWAVPDARLSPSGKLFYDKIQDGAGEPLQLETDGTLRFPDAKFPVFAR